jgi:hypothetical protein
MQEGMIAGDEKAMSKWEEAWDRQGKAAPNPTGTNQHTKPAERVNVVNVDNINTNQNPPEGFPCIIYKTTKIGFFGLWIDRIENPMLVGFTRLSEYESEADLAAQRRALTGYGAEKVFTSGAMLKGPQATRDACLRFAREGDCVVGVVQVRSDARHQGSFLGPVAERFARRGELGSGM